MSGKITLLQQVEQINRRRYERLSACARKRLDPTRFWNDANRAYRCPKSRPPLRPADQVVLQNRTLDHHHHHLTHPSDQEQRTIEHFDQEREVLTPLPLRSRQITLLRNQPLTQPTKRMSINTKERDVFQIEKKFRQTLVERLSPPMAGMAHPTLPDPLGQQVQLDMIQLAHEWGIHVYRAQTITEQIIRDIRIKQTPASKAHSLKRLAQKNESHPLPPFSPLHRNGLLAILITLIILIDLAILCWLL